MYLSFTHRRPNSTKKDMMTRSSKFELLYPPNQKEETEKLMKKNHKPRLKPLADAEEPVIRYGKYIHFSVFPFKNIDTSVLVTCDALVPVWHDIDPNSSHANYDEPLTDIKLLGVNDRCLKADIASRDNIIERNKVLAAATNHIGVVNKRLFQMIHEKRMAAVIDKKKQIAVSEVDRKVAQRSENRAKVRLARNIINMNVLCQIWSAEVYRCGIKFWLILIFFRKVFMDIRNTRLKKDQKVHGHFEELLRKIRFRKLAIDLSTKIKAEEDLRISENMPTLTNQIVSNSIRLTTSIIAGPSFKLKIRETIGSALLNLNELEKRLACFNGIAFQLKWLQFKEYKESRIEWNQVQWNKHQSMLVKLSKDKKCSFHLMMENDLKNYSDRFYDFQRNVLTAIYNLEYFRYIEKLSRRRKEANQDDPYATDLPKLRKWVSNVGYAPIVRKSEDLLSTFSGFDRLFDKLNHQYKQRERLGYAAENKEDQEYIEKLEKEGRIGQLIKATQKMQDACLRNRFIFKIEPAFMINLIVCAYHLDQDQELLSLLEKKTQLLRELDEHP